MTLYSSREFLYIEFVTRSGRVSFDKNSLDNSADFKFERRGFNISYEFSDRFVHLGKKYALFYNLEKCKGSSLYVSK